MNVKLISDKKFIYFHSSIYSHSVNMDQSLFQHFSSLLNETIAKRKSTNGNKNSIDDEYNNLEQVPPAPGDPGMQHDMMVEKGIKVWSIVGVESPGDNKLFLIPIRSFVFDYNHLFDYRIM